MSLFGSRVRNEATSESDWDVHLLVPGEEHLGLDVICAYAEPFEQLGWEFDEMINVVVYSHSGWLKRKFLPFYKNVETDKIILYQN